MRKFPVIRKYLRIRNFPVVHKVIYGSVSEAGELGLSVIQRDFLIVLSGNFIERGHPKFLIIKDPLYLKGSIKLLRYLNEFSKKNLILILSM